MSPFGRTTTGSPLPQDCPCGSGRRYEQCCRRLHRGDALAQTPEELMRSRYAAYALGDWDYIFRTWHPRSRPDDLGVAGDDQQLRWTGLEIEGSGLDDDTHGWVAFRASYRAPSGDGVLAERSRFEVRAGRWLYVDGEVADE
ncbi:YchJ family protein [Nocardioides sp. NPDC057767]|uniref:YchJ family protein n=1 Tax=unclassified Nocardioides TaxID=2615069 RepID=UPI0036715E19